MAQWSTSVSTSEERPRGGGEDCSARSQSHRLRLGHRRPRTDPSGRAGAPCQGPGPPLPRTGPGGARRRRTGTPSATATDGRAGGRGDLGRYFIHLLPVHPASFRCCSRSSRMPRSRSRARHPSTLGMRRQVACCARACTAAAEPGPQGRAQVEGLERKRGWRDRMRGRERRRGVGMGTLSLWRTG